MYEIRSMTADELPQVKKLYMSHTRLQRGKYNRHESDIDEWIKSGLTVVGAMHSGELIAFMTYKLLAAIPTCRIGNIYIKLGYKNSYHFDDDTHPVPKILDYILELMENEKYYTWIYSRANIPVYEKLEQRNQDLLYCTKYGYDVEKHQYRYNRYIDEIIPPYGKSKYDAYNKLFGLGQYENEVVIFNCCLKPEYRRWNI